MLESISYETVIWNCAVCGENLSWRRFNPITPFRGESFKEDIFARTTNRSKAGQGNKRKEITTKILKSLIRKDENFIMEKRYT